jgi:ankyrin repeat protein
MSKKSSINDGIYENITEQGAANGGGGVVDSKDSEENGDDNMSNGSRVNSKEAKMNNLMNYKDALYATPLRKSDRHKSRKSPGPDSEKISNIKHQMNGMEDVELKNLMDRTYLNSELGENRIKDFLKDTAHMHKKIEPPGKEHIGSSFSYLARKEHFVNLVHQNILKDQPMDEQRPQDNSQAEETNEKDLINLDVSFEPCGDLEETEKLINKLVDFQNKVAQQAQAQQQNQIVSKSSPHITTAFRLAPTSVANINLNREWVLKKIAMSLEQKAHKKLPPTLPEIASVNQQQLMQNSNLPVVGYLVLGSNGSGKTTICNDIINGNNGTKGLLNRRLLSFYFVNSQNPDCHSLSVFIRHMALQILSYSSVWRRSCETDDSEKRDEDKKVEAAAAARHPSVDHELEEMIENELKLNERVAEFVENKKQILRQKSEPVVDGDGENPESKYSTHPPKQQNNSSEGKVSPTSTATKEEKCDGTKSEKNSPSKKISKIPIKIGKVGKVGTSPSHAAKEQTATEKEELTEAAPAETTTTSPIGSDESIQTGGGEAIADINDQKLEEDIANELREAIEDDITKPTDTQEEEGEERREETAATANNNDDEPHSERPPPLPREKDCRTLLADAYYHMMTQNPEIFESLIVDNIEKNPDDCFKKAILFPLLELAAPKSALLMLVDSIDENYLNDGTLITTLKGKSNTKSRNIAELLSNHIHLLPKWLFLVCTAKKQNKHIVKLFSGFKKLTLDDLRKSHVVKDVQQYIINRLNVDFRGINLNKEIIDSLNQLYIKSNGCLLYLRKVLNGIKENFFTFREIKLIPCTLYGLFLYLCQKSFNKKQYMKIRPILNVLLASSDAVDKDFVFNCLKTHNYTIDYEEFERRLTLMKNILEIDEERATIKIFHNSFCEWLIDVKFSTKKFLCDINEGHLMIAMYYTLITEQLCPNRVRDYIYHLIKTAEYLNTKNSQLDVLMILLESRANLSDCFYTNFLNCCKACETDFEFDINQSQRTRRMMQLHLSNQLQGDFSCFIGDFFKPSLPTDPKILKLLMETGINNLDSQLSCESSNVNSPLPSDKSQTIDSELAELLISSEKSCNVEQKVTNVDTSISQHHPSVNDNSSTVAATAQYERLDAEMHKGKAFIHVLANDGNHVLMERALRACKGPVDLEIEDHNGQTALNIAARNGHLEIVRLLLDFVWVSDKRVEHFVNNFLTQFNRLPTD